MSNNYEANKFLMKVGVSPDLCGYHYLAEAINATKERLMNNDVNSKFMELYTDIANKFDTNYVRVERNMRHAIEKAFLSNNAVLQDMFGALIDESGRVTVSCFVYAIAEHLIMENN